MTKQGIAVISEVELLAKSVVCKCNASEVVPVLNMRPDNPVSLLTMRCLDHKHRGSDVYPEQLQLVSLVRVALEFSINQVCLVL